MRIRLQKILAAAGVASRRGSEDLLSSGRVTVNGALVRLGDSADPAMDTICLDGVLVGADRPCYWLVHKPSGVLTTRRDPRGRPTVMELLPPGVPRVFPVGRLDYDTEGLVLLTNDGATAQVLLHPSLGNEREYVVFARGAMGEEALKRLARGVELEDGCTAPARVSHVRFDRHHGETSLHLTVREGRKRQIRRALAALGHPIRRLVRVRLGPLKLGNLAPGLARPLSGSERRALLTHAQHLRSAATQNSAMRKRRQERPCRQGDSRLAAHGTRPRESRAR
ncbi:MAG TPA: pseudouridine synthase [Myxococcota bacterium]|nr:pseudouridine synthase [Myxococcota bacterium]